MIAQDNTATVLSQLRAKVLRGVRAAVLVVEVDAKLLSPVLTGHNRRSIYSQVNDMGPMIRAFVSHQSDYGGYLETGTRFMRAQPYLRPALDKNMARIPAIIAAGGE